MPLPPDKFHHTIQQNTRYTPLTCSPALVHENTCGRFDIYIDDENASLTWRLHVIYSSTTETGIFLKDKVNTMAVFTLDPHEYVIKWKHFSRYWPFV